MITIYKYPFVRDEQRVVIRTYEGAEILDVQMQYGSPCIWIKVDTDRPGENREFYFAATGKEMDIDEAETLLYIGTYQDSPFVWHVFEVKANVL